MISQHLKFKVKIQTALINYNYCWKLCTLKQPNFPLFCTKTLLDILTLWWFFQLLYMQLYVAYSKLCGGKYLLKGKSKTHTMSEKQHKINNLWITKILYWETILPSTSMILFLLKNCWFSVYNVMCMISKQINWQGPWWSRSASCENKSSFI